MCAFFTGVHEPHLTIEITSPFGYVIFMCSLLHEIGDGQELVLTNFRVFDTFR